MSSDDQRAEATKIVEVKLGIYIHAGVYVLVNAILIGINFATNPERLWFQWPLLGWGAGLLLHASLAWACIKGGFIKDWMIAGEMEKREKKKHSTGIRDQVEAL